MISKSFSDTIYNLLSENNEPMPLTRLVAFALPLEKAKTDKQSKYTEYDLYQSVMSDETPFIITEYPRFKLASYTKVLEFPYQPYPRSAFRILLSSKDYMDVKEIVRRAKAHNLLKRISTKYPEYWLCRKLQEYKEAFIQDGEFKVGLKDWSNPQKAVISENQGPKERRLPSLGKKNVADATPNIYEANLESIIVENLGKIEKGLKLVKRQFNCPAVGRIDILCKDSRDNLVVIELKKFGVRQDSIIDQIARYMGYIKTHVAKEKQAVRGIIVVAKADEKLKYAVSAFSNIEVKTFNLSIQ